VQKDGRFQPGPSENEVAAVTASPDAVVKPVKD
jgi:hypothetical protein